MRLAMLTNIPAPYRLPVYRALKSRCELLVIFDREREPNRSWEIRKDIDHIPHAILSGITIAYKRHRRDLDVTDHRYLQISPGIVIKLHRFRPDVVVSGEMGFRSLVSALYSWFYQIPFIIAVEGTPYTDAGIGPLRWTIRRLLVRAATRLWSNGSGTTELLISYGAERERIDEGMTGVDTRFFADRVKDHLASREQLRREMRVEGTVFLFVGQLIPRKGVGLLVDALASLRDEKIPRCSVIFVGDGPDRNRLADKLNYNDKINVIFTGFVQLNDLPKYFAIADVFVLPTLEDVWALATLEASVAGLPQIFSSRAGASRELQSMGCSGRLIDPAERGALRRVLKDYIIHTPPRLKSSVIETVSNYYSAEKHATRALNSIYRAVAAYHGRNKS